MFKVLIRNWATNVNVTTGSCTIVSTETEVLNIPVSSPDLIWLSGASIKAECNKAESFDFNVDPGSQYYNAFLPHKTWIRVTYDGTTIFWGCVKSVTNSTILQKRSIHAEGSYAALNDTPVEGKEEDLQPNITMDGYFHDLINNHNSYIEDDLKKFSIGNISITLSSEAKKRAATGWSTTVSELDKLIDETGGYVRARYNERYPSNGANCNYFDWTKYYFRDLGANRPTFKLSRNLIDLSKGTENTEIFTRVIPIGHKTTTSDSKESKFVYLNGSRYIKVKDVPNETSVDDEFRSSSDFIKAEDNYGIIYKTVNFENASTPAQLREYCLDWIKKNYFGIIHNFSVKGIDMHMLGESDAMILVGDCVNVTYPEFDNDGTPHTITRKVIVKAIQYDLLHPENNTYTLGVPCDAVDFEYGSKAKKKTSKAAATQAEETRTQAGGGSPPTPITWSTVRSWLLYYYYSVLHADVVEWTETRWTTWKKQTINGTEDMVVYTREKDMMPHDTFDANKEFFRPIQTEDGVDSDGNTKYTIEKKYTYATFTRPGSNSTVKGKVIGHYQIDKTKRKQIHAGYDAAKGGDITYLTNGHYGVCISTDGHVYTFNWNAFYGVYYDYQKAGNLDEMERQTFQTYFEIARVSNGKLSAASQEAADQGNADHAASNPVTPVTYKNYNGDIMVAIDAEGIVSTGFIKGDDGKPVPTIVLNKPITITNPDGTTKTIYALSGEVDLPDIGPFSSEAAKIENLLAGKVAATELRSAFAAFGVDYGTESYVFDEDGNPVLDEKGNWKLKEGTSFYTTMNTIGAAAGAYYVNEHYDENGQLVRDIVMKDGGGYKVTKDGVEYGLYDERNLTGGLIVEKINKIKNDDGTYATSSRLNGDIVSIGDKSLTKNISDIELDLIKQGNKIVNIDSNILTFNGRLNQNEAELASQKGSLAKINANVVVLGGELDEHDKALAEQYDSITIIKSDLTKVKKLLADVVETDDLDVHDLANINRINAKALVLTGATAGSNPPSSIIASNNIVSIHDFVTNKSGRPLAFNVIDVQPNSAGDTLTITYADGTVKTFKKAAPTFVSGSWGGTTSAATFTFRANPANTSASIKTMGFGEGAFKNADFKMVVYGKTVRNTTYNGVIVPNHKTLPVAIASLNDSTGEVTDRFIADMTIDCRDVYNAGFDAVTAPSVTVPQGINTNTEQTSPGLTVTVDSKTTGAGRSRSLSFRLSRSVYGSNVDRCVNMQWYNSATSRYVTIGRISVQADYNAGFNAVSKPTIAYSSGILTNATTVRTAISITASTDATTNGVARSLTKSLRLKRSVVSETQRYVEVYPYDEPNNIIGRISVQADYNAGKIALSYDHRTWDNGNREANFTSWNPTSRNITFYASNGDTITSLNLRLSQSSDTQYAYVSTDDWSTPKWLSLKLSQPAISVSASPLSSTELKNNPSISVSCGSSTKTMNFVISRGTYTPSGSTKSHNCVELSLNGSASEGAGIIGRITIQSLVDQTYATAWNAALDTVTITGTDSGTLSVGDTATLKASAKKANGENATLASRSHTMISGETYSMQATATNYNGTTRTYATRTYTADSSGGGGGEWEGYGKYSATFVCMTKENKGYDEDFQAYSYYIVLSGTFSASNGASSFDDPEGEAVGGTKMYWEDEEHYYSSDFVPISKVVRNGKCVLSLENDIFGYNGAYAFTEGSSITMWWN